MVTKTERNLFRAVISMVMMFLLLCLLGPMLAGCANVRDAFGGEMLGASVSLGNVTIGASVKIPLGPSGENSSDQARPADLISGK